MSSQAEKLKYFVNKNIKGETEDTQSNNFQNKSRIIAVASGKGGVGKSTITVNLALALKKLEKNILLIDCDIGMANIDVLFGLKSQYDLNHVLRGKCSLKDAIVKESNGLSILSGISGLDDIVEINTENITNLLADVSEVEKDYDLIILDTGAGANKSVLNFTTASDEILIILTPEPTAIMDSYSLLKILYNQNYQGKLNLVINMTDSENEAEEIVNRFIKTARDYLNLNVNLMGIIPAHKHITKSVREQKPVFNLYPNSNVNDSFLEIAGKLIGEEPEMPSRGMKSFFYKLIGQINPRG